MVIITENEKQNIKNEEKYKKWKNGNNIQKVGMRT